MDVDFLGAQGSISEDLRERAVAKIGRLGRFAPLLERAELRLTHDADRSAATRWACHAVLRGHGHELHGRAEATDPLTAVDFVVEKLERQVERLKGKLIDRSHPRHEQTS
ncbi:MAG: ribosome hibernation-promoting factor, HPF/YfiA family [Acidimicrobiales bacterium]